MLLPQDVLVFPHLIEHLQPGELLVLPLLDGQHQHGEDQQDAQHLIRTNSKVLSASLQQWKQKWVLVNCPSAKLNIYMQGKLSPLLFS